MEPLGEAGMERNGEEGPSLPVLEPERPARWLPGSGALGHQGLSR